MPVVMPSTEVVFVGVPAGITVAALPRSSRPNLTIALVGASALRVISTGPHGPWLAPVKLTSKPRVSARLRCSLPVIWINLRATAFKQDSNEDVLEDCTSLAYQSLVAAAGLQLD